MKKFKTLESIVGERVKVRVSATHAPFSILEDSCIRYGTEPVDKYQIIWEYYHFDAETDEERYETIAAAEIWSVNTFEDFDQAADYMDECSQETYDSVIYSEEYYKKYPEKCEKVRSVYENDLEIYLYNLHTFYVSPKFRNKGIGTLLILQLPELMLQLGLVNGLMYICINPFVRQDIDLSGDENIFSEQIEYSYQETEESKKIADIFRKLLEKCGFSTVDDKDHYIISMQYLREQAVKNKVLEEIGCDIWEHE
jgi:GNAT superfamily N-acetyltransferase